MNKLELLEGLEPTFVEDIPKDIGNNVPEMPLFSCSSNLPECGGPIYSNTFWLPEDVEELLNDFGDKITK